MKGHEFSFPGGDQLTGMGATWFVSYCYYKNKDRSHVNWKNVTTAKDRISRFERSKEYHLSWLEEVLKMNDKNLAKAIATMRLTPEQTKRMARELLGQ